MAWEVGKYIYVSPNSNPNCANVGTTAGFVLSSAVRSLKTLEDG
jgi:hypothetical protein